MHIDPVLRMLHLCWDLRIDVYLACDLLQAGTIRQQEVLSPKHKIVCEWWNVPFDSGCKWVSTTLLN